MGRFILNVMLASGGYNWTIIPMERREYMFLVPKKWQQIRCLLYTSDAADEL